VNVTEADNEVELCGDLLWGEAPRPFGDEIWLSDTQAGQLVRISPSGVERHQLENPTNGLWFLPDGRLAAAIWSEKRIDVFVDGAFAPHADLSHLVRDRLGDMTGTPEGRLYVDDMGIDPHSGEPVGRVLIVEPDGSARVGAEGLRFPNGLAVLGNILVVAETHGACLTAFDILEDGGLANRRVWSDLAVLLGSLHRPDGIWPAGDGSIWIAATDGQEFVRVAGDQILDRVSTGGSFAVACCVKGDELYLSTSRSTDPALDLITEAIPQKRIRGRLTRLHLTN
jgi:sugar lactone lactonase YvrE